VDLRFVVETDFIYTSSLFLEDVSLSRATAAPGFAR